MTSKKPHSFSRYVRFSNLKNNETRKGYVPVVVGVTEITEKFMVQTRLMKHPSIVSLLELSASEFGYDQQGVIQIPCEPEFFRELIDNIARKKNVIYFSSPLAVASPEYLQAFEIIGFT
ncbi:hypothetical protein Ancab_011406 [Ancistrocladus abbreviatus]